MYSSMNHGHVRILEGIISKACGGPPLCGECSAELVQFGFQELLLARQQLVQWRLAAEQLDDIRLTYMKENTRLKLENEALKGRVGRLEGRP